ncbi:MAG: hypothetical protein ACREQ5_12515, partial [Candidatus Dormibacteria bacterium]
GQRSTRGHCLIARKRWLECPPHEARAREAGRSGRARRVADPGGVPLTCGNPRVLPASSTGAASDRLGEEATMKGYVARKGDRY